MNNHPIIIPNGINSYENKISFKTLVESIDNGKLILNIEKNYIPNSEKLLSTVLFFSSGLPLKSIYLTRVNGVLHVLKGNKTLLNLYLFYKGISPINNIDSIKNIDYLNIQDYISKIASDTNDIYKVLESSSSNKLIDINYKNLNETTKKYIDTLDLGVYTLSIDEDFPEALIKIYVQNILS